MYQWSVVDRKIRCRLDARKILPSSESISTLDIEAARDGHVTALSLLDKPDGAQLYIGTSKGVIIVAQALQVRQYFFVVVLSLTPIKIDVSLTLDEIFFLS